MAAKKKETNGTAANNSVDEFAADLITALNKESGDRIAYNLATDISPTHIKRWVSTGSIQLDAIIANRLGGGLPEGRVIEIFGPPSIGKSHIAVHIARATQKMGGIVVYMDTENATQIENLQALGVDISRRFVFCEPSTVEECFQVAEKTIMRAKEMQKDTPVTIIWDSVAASPPKAEAEADYDKDLMGVKARALSKGMRKITNLIGNKNITFVCLNQTREKIGFVMGDPTTVPGGKAIPFHASTRIKLGAGSHIKDEDGRVIGIEVSAKTVKNKIAYPFREARFRIMFGKGILEHEEIFDTLRVHCDKIEKADKESKGYVMLPCENDGNARLGVKVHGTSSWKTIDVMNLDTGEILREEKFYKKDFDDVLRNTAWQDEIRALLASAYIIRKDGMTVDDVSIDHESLAEIEAVSDLVGDAGGISEVTI